MPDALPKFATRDKLREHIVETTGIPLGKSTFDKMCAPACGKGPEVAAWMGERPLYDLNKGVEWALRSLLVRK
jgi:hypothetical protein